MAEFCRQCANELGFPDRVNDLAGITSINDMAAGQAPVVICEGCGLIQIDPDGNCLSPDCLRVHVHVPDLPGAARRARLLVPPP